MKKLIVIAVAVAAVFTSCGVGGTSLKTDVDSVAYAIGIDLGTQLRMTDSTMNPKIIAQGLIEAFNQKNELTRDSATKFLQEYFMVRLPEKRKQESVAFLEKIEKENPNVKKTESGLLYEVIMPGNDQRPDENTDKVKVFYTGTFKNGNEFDSSKDTAEFRLHGGVIKGWSEGLQMIGKGGKIKLWIPADLAYGSFGRGQIGPNEALVFDIDLLDFTEKPVTEEK